MKKKVYLLAGSNGSGKTTIARELLKEYSSLEFLNADEIAKELNNDDYNAVKISAGKIFFKKFNEFVEKERSFIIETTLSGKYLEKYINILKEKEYNISMIYVFLDNPSIAIMRVQERVKQGGHFIPDEDIKRRFLRSFRNFWNIYRFLVDDWELVYNGVFGNVREIVAKGIKEKIKILNEEKLEKFLWEVDAMKKQTKLKENKTKYNLPKKTKLEEIISRAFRNAVENNRRLGIPNAFCKNGKILFEMPDGTITDKNPF